jgi:hypothetical protein
MLTIDIAQLKKIEQATRNIRNGTAKVLAPAINRALTQGQTAVRREIRKIYVIKQKDIPTKVHKASQSRLQGAIVISGGMLGVDKFYFAPLFPPAKGAGKRKKQLFVRIKKGGGGFVTRGFPTNKFKAPFQRRAEAPRLPIRKLIAIGAPIMASQPTVGPAALQVMGDTLAKRIDYQLTRVLASAGAKR